jgi:hypothetical protein
VVGGKRVFGRLSRRYIDQGEIREGLLTVVAELEVRVAVPVEYGVVVGGSVGDCGGGRGHGSVLASGVVGEVEGDHAVGWAPGVVAGHVEFRAGKRDDVLRYDASMEL